MAQQKARIGDILEIPTKRGLAYVQFSHYHEPPPHMGAIIRVLPGFFATRPAEFQTLADQKEVFYTPFPVQAAISRKIFALVGHAEIPANAKKFPLFRNGNRNPHTGKIDQWWLWDGTTSWKINKLSDEQLDLPIEQGLNDLALIQRLETGWTPRRSEDFIQAARLRHQVHTTPTIKGINHFLLFENEKVAMKAEQLLLEEGFKSELLDNGSGFSLKVQQGAPLTDEYIEHVTLQLSDIARKSGGIYDAWETELQ